MKRQLSVIMLVILLISMMAFVGNIQPVRAAATINVPGDYLTIQAAINAAIPGDTINVAAGTYDEQVVIEKGLTLQGVGDTTIIRPSSTDKLATIRDGSWYGDKNIAAIVLADGVNSVTIKNLKVDGSGVITEPADADNVAGIFFRETGGAIDSVTVTDMTVGTTGTAVRGYGIYLSAAANPVTVEVENSNIRNFDKNGIETNNNMLTANIHDNTINGRGPLPAGDEVQNGVLINEGSTANVYNNVISDMEYTPLDWWSTGILFYEADGSADGNTINNVQSGIIFQDGSGSAQGNTINGETVIGLWVQYNTEGAWFVSFVDNTVSVAKDSLGYGGIGGLILYENAAIGAQTWIEGASLTITIDGNHLVSASSTFADGIIIGDKPAWAAGDITAMITNNEIFGWHEGIHFLSSVRFGSTVTDNTIQNNGVGNGGSTSGIHIEEDVDATAVSVNSNTIEDNEVFAIYNDGDGTLNAENNWWGSGYPDFADLVSYDVDFSPYYSDSAKTTLKNITVKSGGSIGTDCSFTTIQSAIDAASSGDTINVLAGTYNENLNINKQVSLTGPNAGINPNTGTLVAEAVITDQVTIVHDGVTLDGFTVTNPSGSTGILVNKVSNAALTNNIINEIHTTGIGSAQGIYVLGGASPIANFVIEHNKISNIGNLDLVLSGSSSSAKGIFIGDSSGTSQIGNVVISDNVIFSVFAGTVDWPAGRGAYGVLVNYGCSAGGSTTGLQITNNIIGKSDGYLEGLWAHAIGLEGNTPSAIVTGNIISNLVDHKTPHDAVGIFFEDNPSADTVTIQNNRFEASVYNPSAGTVTVQNNRFATSVYWGVANGVPGTIVNAANNWWGHPTGPHHSTTWTYMSAPYGPHDGQGAYVSDYVLYSPYLTTYHTISAEAGSGGSINPSGTVSISDGSAMSFTITPNTGYYIADVLVDGVSVGAVTSYTFSSVTGAHTIAVSFAITPSGIPPGYIAGAVLVVLAATFLVLLFVARRRQKRHKSPAIQQVALCRFRS